MSVQVNQARQQVLTADVDADGAFGDQVIVIGKIEEEPGDFTAFADDADVFVDLAPDNIDEVATSQVDGLLLGGEIRCHQYADKHGQGNLPHTVSREIRKNGRTLAEPKGTVNSNLVGHRRDTGLQE